MNRKDVYDLNFITKSEVYLNTLDQLNLVTSKNLDAKEDKILT